MLLPAAERRGEIHFYVAKSLSYTWRLVLAFLLMAAGLAIQFALLMRALGPRLDDLIAASGRYHLAFLTTNAWVGLPLVLAGVVLLLTKGYQNVGGQGRASQEWRPARRTEIERIVSINAKQKKWDHDLVDITNARGVVGLIGFVILVVVAQWALDAAGLVRSVAVVSVVSFNAAVMLLPFWVTGARFILKNDRLIVKADLLLKLEDGFSQFGKSSGEEFQYQMQTAKAKDGSGDVPHDIKALIAFHEGPPNSSDSRCRSRSTAFRGPTTPISIACSWPGANLASTKPGSNLLRETSSLKPSARVMWTWPSSASSRRRPPATTPSPRPSAPSSTTPSARPAASWHNRAELALRRCGAHTHRALTVGVPEGNTDGTYSSA